MADDLLKPEEIEALLKSAGPSGGSAGGAGGGLPYCVPVGRGTARFTETRVPNQKVRPSACSNRRKQDLAAAIAPASIRRPAFRKIWAMRLLFNFNHLIRPATSPGDGLGLNALQDVELDFRIELGRTELLIEEVLQLREGSVVPLNKLAGDPVDILVNGRLVARGEVLVFNDNFCVRIAEIVAPTL